MKNKDKRFIGISAAYMAIALVGLIALNPFAAQAAPNRVADGGQVEYTNTTGSNIQSGDLVDLGDRYGVAAGDITSNTMGVVWTEGQFRFYRTTTNAITQGTALYRSSATSITVTATADTYVGALAVPVANVATAAYAAGVYAIVDLNADQRQGIVGTDVQAYDADLTTLGAGNGSALTGNVSAAALSPGSTMSAVNIAAATNLPGSAILPAGVSRTNAIVTTITNFNVTIIDGRITAWTVQ